jgi:hypothetical protein
MTRTNNPGLNGCTYVFQSAGVGVLALIAAAVVGGQFGFGWGVLAFFAPIVLFAIVVELTKSKR